MKSTLKIILFFTAFAAAEAVALLLPDSPKQPQAAHPYLAWVIAAFAAAYLIRIITGFLRKEKLEAISYKAPFYTGVMIFLTLLNLFTGKLAALPTLYFPALDRIFGTIIEDRAFILKCVSYSFRIWLTGVAGGMLVGFFMGVAMGFSKGVSYWLQPIIRILGPIPSTAWIPILLISFPSARSASAFIIGLSVWFPMVVMTSSGVLNVPKAYFEVSSTLGSGTFRNIFRVAVPAAMPSIFQGMFNSTCGSFIALMTAEMIGAKYGIGWYVNWQKEMMAYANVYAGLIVIALLFYLIVTALFRIRDYILVWQRGVIRW